MYVLQSTGEYNCMLENVILIESSIKNLLNMIWLKGHRVALLLVGGDATIMVHAKG